MNNIDKLHDCILTFPVNGTDRQRGLQRQPAVIHRNQGKKFGLFHFKRYRF